MCMHMLCFIYDDNRHLMGGKPHRGRPRGGCSIGGVLGKWAHEKTDPTDKLTLLSGSIASGESRTRLGWLPSALQHSILLILNPALPSGPQDSPGEPPDALKRRSGRGSRQLILSRRPRRRCLRSSTKSRPRRCRCPRSGDVGAWEPKIEKLEIKAGPQGHTIPLGSAARAECAAQSGPWRVGPRRPR